MNRSAVSILVIGATRFSCVDALHAAQAPSRLKIFNWGENDSTKGKFIVNDTTLAALAGNQRALGYEHVALDFEHNTVPGTPEYDRTQEPRPVAAFGAVEVIKGDGVYLNALDWRRPDSRKEYIDLSPTPGTNSSGEVTFIHSVALCRNGAVFGLTIDNAHTLSTLLSVRPTDHKSMNNATALTFITLAALIGLPETATEADVKKKFSDLNALDARMKTLEDLKLTTLTGAPGNLIALDARLKKAEDFITAQGATEIDNIISLCAREGKVLKKEDGAAYTAEELKKLDVALLKHLSANAAATVPLHARARGVRETPVGPDKLTTLNSEVAKHRAANPSATIEQTFAALRADAAKAHLFN